MIEHYLINIYFSEISLLSSAFGLELYFNQHVRTSRSNLVPSAIHSYKLRHPLVVSLPLSVSVFISLSVFLFFCLCLSLSISLSLPLCFPLSISISLSTHDAFVVPVKAGASSTCIG